MNKSKYSRKKKITKRTRTIKYRQYGGEDDKKEKVVNFENLKKEIESAQIELSKDLTELLNAKSELIKNPHNVSPVEINEKNEKYTNSVKLVEAKKEALDKQTTEIINHLMKDMQAVKDMHSNNGSTTNDPDEHTVPDEHTAVPDEDNDTEYA